MSDAVSSALKFGFDEFELETQNGELRKNGTIIKLQLQPLKVLAFLVARAGRVVPRDEIRQHLWGESTFVDYEQGLNYCVSQIRAALGEDTVKPRYIETIPRRGYRFIARVAELSPGDASSPERVMLAVLPLENLSANREQEYLSDGLTGEIITELGSLCPQTVGVIARTSAIQYKRTTKSISQIGSELSVEYVVEGTLRREGNRVRISAQLIRVSDQTHIWSRSYERRLDDVLLLQRELALAIAGEVQGKLAPREWPPVVPGRQVNPEAYEACLKARYLWNRRTRDDLFRALEFFARAIEMDLEYPPAFAGLADVYLVLADYRYMPPNEALALATGAAMNALRLDERLADAHTSLGHAKLHTFEWEESERRFQRAIELGPAYAPAHFFYANLLAALSRFEEAIVEARQAFKLDPVSTSAQPNLTIMWYHAGNYDEAMKSCRKVLEMYPGLPRTHDDLGRILLEQGHHSQAVAAFEKAVSLSNRDARYVASLGHAYGVTGRRDRACEILAELKDISKQRYLAAYDIASVNAAIDEPDQAFYWLERAIEERSSPLPFLNIDPRMAKLRTDPRFQALLARMGLNR
jgi:TolB-like protein/Flp pilus assembly protein TadD